MQILIDIEPDPSGRLAGTASLVGEPTAHPFSGVMELVAQVERLAATDPPSRPASPGR